MIKKISVEQLQLGMYIHDLNCAWMEHGFLRSRFPLKAEATLQKIRDLGIHEVYIDTDRGSDVAPPAQTDAEVREDLEKRLAEAVSQEPVKPQRGSLAEERVQARRLQNEATGIVIGMMEDARLGRPVDLGIVTPLAEQMAASIFRNQDALLALTRIRRMGRYMAEHSVNVSVLLMAFSRGLGFNKIVTRELGVGGLLHDLGKASIPASILAKPGKLTDAEFAVMREHVRHTYNLISKLPGLSKVALAVALEHHERVDGSGYPKNKKGDAISQFGKMAAIADVYDAITTNRVFQKSIEPHQGLRKLLEWSGYHFDADLVQQFIRSVGIYPIGTLVRLRSGRLGIVLEAGKESPFKPVVRVVMDANRRRYLTVEDIDLSRQPKGSEEKIETAELPERWRINPDEVLQLPV